MSDKHASKTETIAAKRMLDAVGIKYWQHQPVNRKIVIDFNDIDWNNMNQLPPTPKRNITDELSTMTLEDESNRNENL